MPRYRYEALSAVGELVRGDLEAPDADAAARRLQSRGQIPVFLDTGGPGWLRAASDHIEARRGIGARELAVFTRELAALQHAGLPLDRSLHIIAELSRDARLRALAAGLQEAVRGGQPLSEALEAQGGAFSRFYVSMVRAAEAAGALDAGLARLAEHQERAKALRDTLLSALAYPAVVLAVAGVSLVVVLAFVVPQFTQLFADAGRALPLPARVVVEASSALRDYWWALVAVAAAGALALRLALGTAQGRRRRDALVLRLPVAGELVRRVDMARLSRSLATLTGAGVPLVRAVAIAGGVLSNRALAEALELAAEGLKAGRGLAAPLAATGVFPPLALQMMKVGEETGRLEPMLERIAELYDREVAAGLQRLLALLEPALIVGLGSAIGAIVLSLLSALASIHDLPL